MYLIDKMLDPAEMIAYLSVEWPTYEKLRHISNLPYSIRIFFIYSRHRKLPRNGNLLLMTSMQDGNSVTVLELWMERTST